MNTPYQLEDRIAPRLRRLEGLSPLMARITLATAFWVSGRGKFKDMKGTAGFFRELGIPLPGFMARFVAATEVGCGISVGAGVLTRAAAIPLIPIMVVAILTARRKEIHSFSDLTGIYEFSYIILLSYLVMQGGGKLSVDTLTRRLLERRGLRSHSQELPSTEELAEVA